MASAAMAIVNRIEAPNMIGNLGRDKARSKAGEQLQMDGDIALYTCAQAMGSSLGWEMNRIITIIAKVG